MYKGHKKAFILDRQLSYIPYFKLYENGNANFFNCSLLKTMQLDY